MSREMYLIDAAKNDVINLHWITGSEWGTVRNDKGICVIIKNLYYYNLEIDVIKFKH